MKIESALEILEILISEHGGEESVEALRMLVAESAPSAASNTGSPKLPESNEIRKALTELRSSQGLPVTDIEYGVLGFVYEFIVRQLQAGA